MGYWKRFKKEWYARSDERDGYVPGTNRQQKKPDANDWSLALTTERDNRRRDEQRHQRENERAYGHGFQDGRYHEREVRAAYIEGWQDRRRHEQRAQEQRRHQHSLSDGRSHGHGGHHDHRHGGGGHKQDHGHSHGHSGRSHENRRSSRHDQQGSSRWADHDRMIGWK